MATTVANTEKGVVYGSNLTNESVRKFYRDTVVCREVVSVGANSCNLGAKVCQLAGIVGDNSCKGNQACQYTNVVGNGSCRGEYSCLNANEYNSERQIANEAYVERIPGNQVGVPGGTIGNNVCNDGKLLGCGGAYCVPNDWKECFTTPIQYCESLVSCPCGTDCCNRTQAFSGLDIKGESSCSFGDGPPLNIEWYLSDGEIISRFCSGQSGSYSCSYTNPDP